MHAYELLEAAAISGQMSQAQLQQEFAADPEFKTWFEARAEARNQVLDRLYDEIVAPPKQGDSRQYLASDAARDHYKKTGLTELAPSIGARIDDLEKQAAWFRHLCDLRGDLLKVRAEELRKRNAEYDMVVRRCAEQAKAYAALMLQLRDMNAEPEPEPNPIFSAIGVHQSQGIR